MLTESDSRQILDVEVAYISASPTNPRKSFPKGPLDELAASIKERGVQEPATVRIHPKQVDHFELVHGERRWRASKVAGRDTIPAILIKATDQEVLELQLLDHGQRQDLSPLEEAAAHAELHTKFKVPVASIAKKIGKSLTYVYGRLSLAKLVPAAAKAFEGGTLTLDAALVLSRVPAKLQPNALKEMTGHRFGDDGPVTGAQARADVQENYMLKLADAPFDRGDADLVKAAGPCTTCPKRTGNQAELFADIESPDMCVDPECHKEKSDAWWARKTAEAGAKGKTVLSDDEAKKLFHYGHVKTDSKFVDLKEHNYTDPKNRTWGQILGKQKPPVVLARDADGKVHELVAKEEAGLALKKIGGTTAKLAPEKKRQADPHAARMQREAWIRRKAADSALGLLVAAAAKRGATIEVLRVVVYGLIREVWADRIKAVLERRGLAAEKKPNMSSAMSKSNQKVLEDAAKKMAMGDLLGLAVELVASRDAYSAHHRFDSDALAQACAELKVDWGKCQAAAKAERAEKDKGKKKPAKKAKASK